MKGASLKEVQEILGHKSMTMTLRYAHLSQEHKKKAVNLLNDLTVTHPNSCVHERDCNHFCSDSLFLLLIHREMGNPFLGTHPMPTPAHQGKLSA